MAEHEWEKDDAVWFWSDYTLAWSEGILKWCDDANRRAIINSGVVVLSLWAPTSQVDCVIGYDDLRRRDPALDGDDKPTAESEAKR